VLTGTSLLQFGETRISSALMLGALYRAQLIWRHELLFDSRFSAPHPGPRELATIYLVHAGEVTVDDRKYSTPVALVASAREFECYEVGAPFVRTSGDPCVTVDLMTRTQYVRAPIGLSHGPVPISPQTWDAVSAMADALAMGTSVVAPTHDLARGLVADGIVAPELAEEPGAEAPSIERIWNAISRYHDNLDMSIQLADLAEQALMSSRQLSRDVHTLLERVGLEGLRFREIALTLRLRLATLLLSARHATIAEVAERAGYASIDALGRAFRDAGLPPPSDVRARVVSPNH
jgi:AraC-like DNA-binding protein